MALIRKAETALEWRQCAYIPTYDHLNKYFLLLATRLGNLCAIWYKAI